MLAGFPDLHEVGQEAVLAQLLGLLMQHLAIADDRVQRRPQLVAHAGEELALRLGRGLGFVLGFAQLPFCPLALDHTSKLRANLGCHVQERLMRFDNSFGEELQDGDDVLSHKHGETERSFDTQVRGHLGAWKVPVLRDVRDPRRLAAAQHSTWQPVAGPEARGLAHAPKRLEPFAVVKMPDPRGHQLLADEHIGVPDRPASLSADLIEGDPNCAFDAGGFIGGGSDDLIQRQEFCFLTQRLLGPLEFGHVREDAHRTTILCLALTNVDPAAVALEQKRSARVAMLSKSSRHPFLGSLNGIGDDATLDHRPEHLLKLQPWLVNVSHAGKELTIARIAQHHPIIGVVQEEAFRDALQRVGQSAASLCRLVARVRQLLRAELERALEHGTIAVEIGIGGVDRRDESLQGSRHFVVDAEILSQLAAKQSVHPRLTPRRGP